MVRVRPIPPRLWQRMAALDDRYDFHLSRTDVPKVDANGFQAGRRLFKRLWTVTVIPTGGTAYIAKCEAADLASALEGAVEGAERARLPISDPPR